MSSIKSAGLASALCIVLVSSLWAQSQHVKCDAFRPLTADECATLVGGQGSNLKCQHDACKDNCSGNCAGQTPGVICGYQFVAGAGDPGWRCVGGVSTCFLSDAAGASVTSKVCVCTSGGTCVAMQSVTCAGRDDCCLAAPCP